MLYAAAIIFFCFFYTALQYNPKETADNLKKSGAFVPGIRPGDQTAQLPGEDHSRGSRWSARSTSRWCACCPNS